MPAAPVEPPLPVPPIVPAAPVEPPPPVARPAAPLPPSFPASPPSGARAIEPQPATRTKKHATDANYEAMTRFVLEHARLLRPAFGSHNVRSLAHAMAAAQLLGLSERAYEIQMLYGMADPIKDALVHLGQRVRVYTPYGQLLPGMAYLVRRLLENTANTSFLRASFTEHVPEERLLMNPMKFPSSGNPAPTSGGYF